MAEPVVASLKELAAFAKVKTSAKLSLDEKLFVEMKPFDFYLIMSEFVISLI